MPGEYARPSRHVAIGIAPRRPRFARRVLACIAIPLLAFTALALPLGDAQTPPPADKASAAATASDETVPPNVQHAVERALDFCKTQQLPDGTFSGIQGNVGETAVPALVVMAYLAHGDVPGQGPYGDVINHAIDYVLNSQQPDGVFAHTPVGNVMYEHAICTVMLSESYGMVDDTRRARIDKALSKSVAVILAAQKVRKSQPVFEGGWRYTPQSNDSDLSCTGWQLMALRGAANCGAAVPPSAISAGVEYIHRSAIPGGGFAYVPNANGGQGQPNQARTGTGILALELLGQHNDPQSIAAGDWLLNNPPDRNNIAFYYYAVYYCSQAVNQLGGKYWTGVYPKLVRGLLTLQLPNGSFGGATTSQEEQAGPCYRSAMACLALCVPYRYLPLYQK